MSTTSCVRGSDGQRPVAVGVLGGSFNPIHLGHALLAITTQQTKQVDSVVLVPVFKHHVKTDLLPFEDRVAMCELAIAPFRGESGKGVEVSTVEQEVGESNAAMLRALKGKYPAGSKLYWICGDDVFDWIENPKGLETMREVSGLIVQRRLHKTQGNRGVDRFFKAPLDESKIRTLGVKLNLEIDFIYGELPHFSSTLVRKAPGSWRSFLPQAVARYLDARPKLLSKLRESLDVDARAEADMEGRASKRQRNCSKEASRRHAAACVMHGVEVVHALQRERGQTGLRLSMGTKAVEELLEVQKATDMLVEEDFHEYPDEKDLIGYDEVLNLKAELRQTPVWLARDRAVVETRSPFLATLGGAEAWAGRCALVDKYTSRIAVLMDQCLRALNDIFETCGGHAENRESVVQTNSLSELLLHWSQGKEALGRLRAFVCAGGPTAPLVVRSSLVMRQRLHDMIEHKERQIARVLSLQVGMAPGTRLATPDALHQMLEKVTTWEWALMGCFASSTPLPMVHKIVSEDHMGQTAHHKSGAFDVEKFFLTTSAAIDLMLSIVKALAASGCAMA